MHRRLLLLMLVLSLFLSACNLTAQQERLPTATPTQQGQDSGKPRVTITAPTNNAQVRINELVLVRGTAGDDVGITRIQLLANNQPVQTKSFSGEKNTTFTLDYTPVSRGEVTLSVIAYRNTTASDPATVTLTVGQTNIPTAAVTSITPQQPTINPNDPTCRAQTNSGLNVRSLPSTQGNIITTLSAGTVVPVVGRLGDNSWWQVRIGAIVGWVSAPFTTLYGSNCAVIPVINTGTLFTATPRPATETPTATAPPPTNTPGTPNLLISRFDGPDSAAIASGETSVDVDYSVTVTNSGSGPARNFDVSLRVVGGETRISQVSVLRRGESIVLPFTVTFTAGSNYTLIAEADSGGVVGEISEADNLASRPIVITVSP
jgi:hypothetical protein